MSIERFYTTTFTLKRVTWNNESSAEVSGTSFTGHIQQASPEYVQQLGEAVGQVFLIWCDKDTDVQASDTVTVASGDYAGTYSIQNIQVNAVGGNKHLELTVYKDEEA